MNSVSHKFRPGFEELRKRSRSLTEDFRELFQKPVADQWPLQSRVSDFSFLSELSDKEKDKEIMRYALQCWSELRDCAINLKYDRPFICCVVIESEQPSILWPEIYFFNTGFEPLSLLKISEPASKLGNYVKQLVSEVSWFRGQVFEERCNLPEDSKIYVDCPAGKGEKRRSLAEFISSSNPT